MNRTAAISDKRAIKPESLPAMRMPLLEYFVVVGLALVGALFVADYYVPATPAVPRAEVDKSTIRIRSTQKLPELIELSANGRTQTF